MIIQDDTLKLVGDGYRPSRTAPASPKGDTEFQEFVDGVFTEYIDDGRWATRRTRSGSGSTRARRDPPTMSLEEALELRPCEKTC